MLLRLGIASKFALLLTSSIYLSLTRHIYCCASAIASKLALHSASFYIWPDGHIYGCASAEQINLFCTRLLRIFETELSITLI